MPAALLFDFDEKTGIARLLFNRPEVLNAIDLDMARAIRDAVSALAALTGLRCIVLAGNGRAFMAGGDVAGFSGATEDVRACLNDLLDALIPAITGMRALNVPIVAGVRGVAAGAGLSLALSADLVLAEEGARFLMAYDRIGAVADCGGSWFLPLKVGTGRAAELMLLSRTLTAAEAGQWGIVNRVVADDAFDAALDDLVRTVAAGPTRSFAAHRRLVESLAGHGLAEHMERERAAFLALMGTDDFREGVSAFLGKRKADFRGR
ncbi:enoyl-CoA hydratase/isomerase family protein [Paracoccus sp. J55]|uniref:enoyl-CoA hydratase/isomerase family protein n=1 Tax=Paracoccus sp. J55 TaxID=935849 RepID=UPI00048C76F3|nr:enoyl-CoA hydratase-related protein [Paracoccus sp. J55]